VLSAYLPETAPRILDALGQPLELAWENVAYGRLVAADSVEASAPLFPRIEAPATAGA
jgi:methionyl-tRNA synthetase